MAENLFERWNRWADRNSIPELKCPGVYLIAISSEDIQGHPFSWIPEIVYVGMTNALSGLKGRLKQFDNTIVGKTGHGGAQRFRYKYPEYAALSQQLFLTVTRFPCNVECAKARDLRIMGRVAAFEYECLARYHEVFGRLPEFNDKKRSLKGPRR